MARTLLETLREICIWPQLAVELGLDVDLQATVSKEFLGRYLLLFVEYLDKASILD